jgi:hypothetical protein
MVGSWVSPTATVGVKVTRQQGPDLHVAVARGGAPLRPLQGLVEVGDIDEEVTAELFLGLGERPVLDMSLPVA